MENNAVSNPGSAIGEAIGAVIERGVNRLLKPIAEENGCIYITFIENIKTGKPGKLLLKDNFGNTFNIDSVIVNNKMQPLILIESKYIRYKKHNRDKGSWICNTHYNLRRKYPTVRKSIAVLAGNWSEPSKVMMKSYDVTLFEVGFNKIVGVLSQYGVDILWKEKERAIAETAWNKLTPLQMDEIAQLLLTEIEDDLRTNLADALGNTIPHEIVELELVLKTSRGESRRYIFKTLDKMVSFFQSTAIDEILNNDDGPSIMDISPASQMSAPDEESDDEVLDDEEE